MKITERTEQETQIEIRKMMSGCASPDFLKEFEWAYFNIAVVQHGVRMASFGMYSANPKHEAP